MLADYMVYTFFDFLEFGFPFGYLGDDSILNDKNNLWKYKNHQASRL